MKIFITDSDIERSTDGISPLITALKRETSSRFATVEPYCPTYGSIRATRGLKSRYFGLSQRAKNYLTTNKKNTASFVLKEA